MKQRLGIGIALLGSPELLILDEPVNGLDPAGIRDVRDLLLELNKKGVTIFISSQLLDELGKIATRFGIMRDGRLVEEVSRETLDNLSRDFLVIRADDTSRASEIISECYPGSSITVNGALIEVRSELIDPALLNTALVRGGIGVSELKYHSVSIEDYFIERMGV
jgi:ABC-2 type transport system ATP-binding protein